jgi:chromosome segregation ATPase
MRNNFTSDKININKMNKVKKINNMEKTLNINLEEYEEMKNELTNLRKAKEHLELNINNLAKTMYEDMYSRNTAHTQSLVKELDKANTIIERLNQYEKLQTVDKYTHDQVIADKEALKNNFLNLKASYDRTTVSIFKYDRLEMDLRHANEKISDVKTELERLRNKWYVKLFS